MQLYSKACVCTANLLKSSVALCVALVLLTAFCALPVHVQAAEAAIEKQLQAIAKKLVRDAAQNVLPKKTQKAVTQEGATFEARYIEIDENSISTELHKGNGNDRVGSIQYKELHYVCVGATKAQALAAPCSLERTRKMTEIVAYTKGKWLYH